MEKKRSVLSKGELAKAIMWFADQDRGRLADMDAHAIAREASADQALGLTLTPANVDYLSKLTEIPIGAGRRSPLQALQVVQLDAKVTELAQAVQELQNGRPGVNEALARRLKNFEGQLNEFRGNSDARAREVTELREVVRRANGFFESVHAQLATISALTTKIQQLEKTQHDQATNIQAQGESSYKRAVAIEELGAQVDQMAPILEVIRKAFELAGHKVPPPVEGINGTPKNYTVSIDRAARHQ